MSPFHRMKTSLIIHSIHVIAIYHYSNNELLQRISKLRTLNRRPQQMQIIRLFYEPFRWSFFVCRLSFNRSDINLLFYTIILLLILLRSRIVIGFSLGLRVKDFKT